MLIDYYRQPANSVNLDENSPIGRSHKFTLYLTGLTADEINSISSVDYIQGVLDQMPAFHYSTKWGNSPAAKVTDTIKKVTEHKYLKMFANNNADYRPPIVTDGWTQQIPESAEPLSIDLSFRSYPKNIYNTTPYYDIIRFLVFATTPKKYQVSHSIDYIKYAINEAYSKGEVFAAHANDLINIINTNADNINKSEVIKTILAASKERLDDDVISGIKEKYAYGTADRELADKLLAVLNEANKISNMSNLNTGGCPLIEVDIPNFISINSSNKVPWIITNWSFKPAINTTYIDNNYYPIYVEFKITLETQYVLTNKEIDPSI